MINEKRLIDSFVKLVGIDNPSHGERGICDFIKAELSSLGIEAREDGSAAVTGGNCGNLYAFVDGEGEPLLLSAHMDSVDPARGKRAVIADDGRITSAGDTVLGADDLSGVAVILEALRSVKESGARHRPIELVFDAAEETYCDGIQQFDFASLKSKQGYIFDWTGAVGEAAYQAPAIISFKAEIKGKAAHAAFSPEEGVHAIKAAAAAVAAVECGRVGDTTVNIGMISGGAADNVVPENCVLTGEVRGFDNDTVYERLALIERAVTDAAEGLGASVKFSTQPLCLAYRVDPDGEVASRFRTACADVGLEPKLVVTYGGSDNNHCFHHGVSGLVVACGMNNCHSCSEYSDVNELINAARLAEALMLGK